jgi:hypothetical protein
MLPARGVCDAYAAREGVRRRGGLVPPRPPPPGAPAVVWREAGASPYLAARLPVVVEPVELRLNRVGFQVGLVILAQLVSAPLRTRT